MKFNIQNISTLIKLIKDTTILGSYINTQQLHSHILKSGHISSIFIVNPLINSYVKLNLILDAHKLLNEIPEPSLVSWNAIISGYVQSGQFQNALYMFMDLEKSKLSLDSYLLTAALSACGKLSLLQVGRSIHSKIVKLDEECNVFVANCLIDMYGKCGCVESFTKVFDWMGDRVNVSWNSVIAAYVRNRRVGDAVRVFHCMPNADRISYNTTRIIYGIAKFGEIEDAVDVLYSMASPNSSSWNAIITNFL